jgi:hypothetical protein
MDELKDLIQELFGLCPLVVVPAAYIDGGTEFVSPGLHSFDLRWRIGHVDEVVLEAVSLQEIRESLRKITKQDCNAFDLQAVREAVK